MNACWSLVPGVAYCRPAELRGRGRLRRRRWLGAARLRRRACSASRRAAGRLAPAWPSAGRPALAGAAADGVAWRAPGPRRDGDRAGCPAGRCQRRPQVPAPGAWRPGMAAAAPGRLARWPGPTRCRSPYRRRGLRRRAAPPPAPVPAPPSRSPAARTPGTAALTAPRPRSAGLPGRARSPGLARRSRLAPSWPLPVRGAGPGLEPRRLPGPWRCRTAADPGMAGDRASCAPAAAGRGCAQRPPLAGCRRRRGFAVPGSAGLPGLRGGRRRRPAVRGRCRRRPAGLRLPLSTKPATPWSASGAADECAFTVRPGSESAPIVSSTPPG